MKREKEVKLIALVLTLVITLSLPYKTFAATNDKENNYPIVMMHGLFGWGNNELYGLNYWGGKESLKQILSEKGYTVFTPTLGSVSSNWDRACELYAYLKGGTVDYGEAHSKKFGHARYGRTFPGVYPELGVLSSSNEIQKIHLVGHSMGGETIRVFTQLLEDGDQDEMKTTPGDSISPLFTGGKHWVDSVTTIATPNDGSQEAGKQYTLEPFTHDFYAFLAANGGVTDSNNPCFDFKLDQWGLKRQPNESFGHYYERVMSSNIWGQTKDLSIWDLTPEGARDMNTWVKAQKDTYYFSIACSDTHKDFLTGHQVPNANMLPLLLNSSLYMGAYTTNDPNKVRIDNSWWENDGVVSVVSAMSPKVGSTDKMVQYNGTPQKGVWNFLGTYKNTDHFEVVALNHDDDRAYLENQYVNLAKMLTSLPR